MYKPAEVARVMWERHNQDTGLDWETFIFLYKGAPRVLIDTPAVFYAARPVKSSDLAGIQGEWVWEQSECDAWFIWVAVGTIKELLAHMPYPLPKVIYHRAGASRLQCYPLRRITGNTHGDGKKLFGPA